MRFVLFYHSLISDWNHGNAHFLRGIVTELQAQGHEVQVFEPENGWSLRNLRNQARGGDPIGDFRQAYPHLSSTLYDPETFDPDEALEGADVAIVHEWNDPRLVQAIGWHRARARSYRLLFHDTHHRAVSAPAELQALDLSNYDGVLAFGEVLREIYERRGWANRAWTWHEAADTRLFRPRPAADSPEWDLVWIGNWGDGERAAELAEYLIEPVRTLGLRACVNGVRYPAHALRALRSAGISYGGWIANFRVPAAFASARFTVHVPRKFYRENLPGIPTIRVFEALACGIPLITAPWNDSERLFEPGQDFLVAANGEEMRRRLEVLRADPEYARSIALRGCRTVQSRHTCAHRVQELLAICRRLGVPAPDEGARAAHTVSVLPATA